MHSPQFAGPGSISDRPLFLHDKPLLEGLLSPVPKFVHRSRYEESDMRRISTIITLLMIATGQMCIACAVFLGFELER